jgi:hypothetical protein
MPLEADHGLAYKALVLVLDIVNVHLWQGDCAVYFSQYHQLGKLNMYFLNNSILKYSELTRRLGFNQET